MNRSLLLATALTCTSYFSVAQQATKTYAITGDGNTGYAWRNIREVNLNTGQTTKTILDASLTQKNTATNLPSEGMVAAAAFDRYQNKLFFAPMKLAELRWIDIDSKNNNEAYKSIKNNVLSNLNLNDEANHITRMDIAANGNGYALTNDANHLIQFTTGPKVTITNLGSVIDAAENKDVSIHNKCTSWGGDMVADAFGKLYIISANHHVFELNIETRIAKHVGMITGLPNNFSTNGAAVNDEGNIVVSSANSFEGYYQFKMKDFAATKIEGSDKTYNASDLANGNLLYQKEADAANEFSMLVEYKNSQSLYQYGSGHVFPNPIASKEFKVFFENQNSGLYNIVLSDLSGRVVMNKVVNVSGKNQIETVQIKSIVGKGIYFVKAIDAAKNVVFTEKVSIQ
jgi:Secretion system C-terminal sorting domain